MPLIGTIEKRDAGILLPDCGGVLHRSDGGEEAEDRHRGRKRHAEQSRARGDCATRPEAASQVWIHEIERPGEEQEAVKVNHRAR